MLQFASILRSRQLFDKLGTPGLYVLTKTKNQKKLRPIKVMSTDCDENPPPLCPPQPCLMDYGPENVGCWKKYYDEKNRKANKDLLLGIVSIIFALIIIDQNGLIKGYYMPLFS